MYHFPEGLNRILFDYIVNEDEFGEHQESQTCAEAKRKLLNLTLSLSSTESDENKQDYLVQIIDKYLFSTHSVGSASSRDMTRFLQYYKNEIFQWICKRHNVIFKYVLGKISLAFVKSVNLLAHVVEYVASTDKTLRKTFGPKLVAYLYENWHVFKEFWQNSETCVDYKLALVNLLTKSLLIESFQVNLLK